MGTSPTTFHELYQRHADDVYRFAHWLTGDAEEARDIVSETFVRVWTSPGEIRLRSVKSYLFTIARNLHRKRWRKSSRMEPLDDGAGELPDPGVIPDQAASNSEDLAMLMDALDTLPELDRTILLLRAQDGLGYDEIAAITGLTVATAKVRVFRARAKLAEQLKSDHP